MFLSYVGTGLAWLVACVKGPQWLRMVLHGCAVRLWVATSLKVSLDVVSRLLCLPQCVKSGGDCRCAALVAGCWLLGTKVTNCLGDSQRLYYGASSSDDEAEEHALLRRHYRGLPTLKAHSKFVRPCIAALWTQVGKLHSCAVCGCGRENCSS